MGNSTLTEVVPDTVLLITLLTLNHEDTKHTFEWLKGLKRESVQFVNKHSLNKAS